MVAEEKRKHSRVRDAHGQNKQRIFNNNPPHRLREGPLPVFLAIKEERINSTSSRVTSLIAPSARDGWAEVKEAVLEDGKEK
ncbi:Os05g0101532 [Oryza sativa Japonica Group]|uniref:Os05g0101532 protein n=1 Tax=Oryza sativa subsp. japonica TaxID=39947 RepID=A0A0P0WGT1_ORYSJ|nr:Os05g0101532 [Oryza sativa Japonica Group]